MQLVTGWGGGEVGEGGGRRIGEAKHPVERRVQLFIFTSWLMGAFGSDLLTLSFKQTKLHSTGQNLRVATYLWHR